MKKLLGAMIMLALVGSAAWAGVPDPSFCEVSPMDDFTAPRLIAIPMDGGSAYAGIDITVRSTQFGSLMANCLVQIVVDGHCDADMCLDCTGVVFEGLTAGDGTISFNFTAGGCCEYPTAAIIYAAGVPIRTYGFIASPDLYGGDPAGADCGTTLGEFATFGEAYATGAPGCTDYSGDGFTTLSDFAIFGEAYNQGCTTD